MNSNICSEGVGQWVVCSFAVGVHVLDDIVCTCFT